MYGINTFTFNPTTMKHAMEYYLAHILKEVPEVISVHENNDVQNRAFIVEAKFQDQPAKKG